MDYFINHTTPEDALLNELNRETHLKILAPTMLSGHFQGRFLQMISQMVTPSRILEIGTYTGYSAICMAKGLKENGELITIDMNDELAPFARKYFEKAGLSSKIKQLVGNAVEIIPQLNGKFDLVFIDAEKTEYCQYYQLIFDKLNIGGYILADNVLWYNKVLLPDDKQDEATKSINRFNKMIQNDQRVENIMLPIRDGLMLVRKIFEK